MRANAVAVVAVLWSVLALSTHAQVSTVKVSYKGPSKVGLHEPIIVQFLLENWTAETIRFDLGFDRTRNFVVAVTRPDGAFVTTDAFPPPKLDEGGRIGRITLAPAERYADELVLNQWFPFDSAGTYQVGIRLATEIQLATGANLDTRTDGLVTLEVGPRDEGILRRICQELADSVLSTQDVSAQLNAARTLSYVTDPLAVSYVMNVLAVTDVAQSLLIPGLVRIGTPHARAALSELAQSGDEGRSALARDGLGRFVLKPQ